MKVSVLMPVYNGEAFVAQAIKSVLRQTFHDFELIVIDDGSTDKSVDIVSGFDDSRIRLFQNQSNSGVAATLNRGLSLARGEYIARMDADDVCVKSRLAKQVEYLDTNSEVGIVGSWIRLFGDQLPLVEKTPVDSDILAAYLIFDNPIFHPTVMLRQSLIESDGLSYNTTFNRTEDFELWIRAAEYTELGNIPIVLHKMRHHKQSVTSIALEDMTKQTCELLAGQLRTIGISPTKEEVLFHHRISRGKRLQTREKVELAEQWLRLLREKNRKCGIHTPKSFDVVLGMIWFRLCRNSTPLGWWIWEKYRQFDISNCYKPGIMEIMYCFLSIFWHRLRGKTVPIV